MTGVLSTHVSRESVDELARRVRTRRILVGVAAKFATADGGLIDRETGKKISDETESTATWSDPKAEVDEYGQSTGDHYVICEECGIEALTALADCADHREKCSR